MPENEFEKKVSSEMQELRFKPSEKVWLQVEERIREKKKRRVFVIIFFFAGLALLGYWQRNNLFGEKGNDIVKNEKQKEDRAVSKDEPNNTITTNQNNETIKQQETKKTADKPGNENLAFDKPVINKANNDNSKNEIYKPKNKRKNEIRVKPVAEKTTIKETQAVPTNLVPEQSQKQNAVSADDRTKDPTDSKEKNDSANHADNKLIESQPIENKIDSAKTPLIEQKKNVAENKDTLLKIKVKDSAAAIVQKKPSDKKWKWGLHVTPGISSLNGQSLSLGSQRLMDAFNYQNPASPTGGPPVTQKPSEVESGFAFQAGASAQRQLSPRTSISLGLQYGYYSTHISIGNRRDSFSSNSLQSNLRFNNNNVYNAGGNTIKLTNQYHFIELPFNFQWQLNKSKTKPFIWSTGFTIGQLIASNALMYDTASNGIYYKNNGLLNKTQFSLSTGFYFTIANTEKARWSIGPVVSIHLNKLFDSPFENERYLFFAGLRANVLFNQKK